MGKVIAVCVVATLMVVAIGGSTQASVATFEPVGFTPGESVHNHLIDGTMASPAVNYTNWAAPAWASIGNSRSGIRADEEIVDVGGVHGKVWRYSTGVDDGNLGATPKSQSAGFVAGETGAVNDAGMGAVTTDTFYGQVDFRSATGAAQDGLAIRLSASSMDSRHGYVNIFDDGAGFDLGFWRADLGVYDSLDTSLSYTDWHTLGIEILFNDGTGDDVVNLYVDGATIYTGPSWEAYYSTPQSVDRLSFDTYLDASHLGEGLYFDNVLISDQGPGAVPQPNAVPEPASLVIWGLLGAGCAGLAVVRRRRRAA